MQGDTPTTPSGKGSGFTPRFLSEYSMGELDFFRFNDHLKYIESLCGEINSTDIPTLEQCQKYFSGLNTLYKLWRPIIASKGKLNTLDTLIKDAKKIKRRWESAASFNFPFAKVTILELADKLDDFHTQLMEMKQIIGLGIKVTRNFSTKERIRMGVVGKKIPNILPEP